MSHNSTISADQADVMSEVLWRIQKGDAPETVFELLNHSKTPEIVTRATVKTSEWQTLQSAFLWKASMSPISLIDILRHGRGFNGRDPEEAEGVISEGFAQAVWEILVPCLKELPPEHPLRTLLIQIPAIVDALIEGSHPMTLAEMQLFEERTRWEKYSQHRATIAKDGKKPLYTWLTGHEHVVQFMNRQIGNSVWINLLLSAIELDDHESIPSLLADADVGQKYRDLQVIMKFIIHDPVLHVSREMFNALACQYEKHGWCLSFCIHWTEAILNDKDGLLDKYRPSLWYIFRLAQWKIQRPASNSPASYILEHGTEEEIEDILQISDMTNVVREHMQNILHIKIMAMKSYEPRYDTRIQMLTRLARKHGFSVKLPIR